MYTCGFGEFFGVFFPLFIFPPPQWRAPNIDESRTVVRGRVVDTPAEDRANRVIRLTRINRLSNTLTIVSTVNAPERPSTAKPFESELAAGECRTTVGGAARRFRPGSPKKTERMP